MTALPHRLLAVRLRCQLQLLVTPRNRLVQRWNAALASLEAESLDQHTEGLAVEGAERGCAVFFGCHWLVLLEMN